MTRCRCVHTVNDNEKDPVGVAPSFRKNPVGVALCAVVVTRVVLFTFPVRYAQFRPVGRLATRATPPAPRPRTPARAALSRPGPTCRALACPSSDATPSERRSADAATPAPCRVPSPPHRIPATPTLHICPAAHSGPPLSGAAAGAMADPQAVRTPTHPSHAL